MAFRLTPKEDSFYELFGVSAGHLVEAAKELTNLLAVETPEERKAVVERMHDLEHLGDEATHDLMVPSHLRGRMPGSCQLLPNE